MATTKLNFWTATDEQLVAWISDCARDGTLLEAILALRAAWCGRWVPVSEPKPADDEPPPPLFADIGGAA